MSEKTIDVLSVCNALVDIVVEAKDEDLEALELTKGIMHLVDSDRQRAVLEHFHGHEKTIELGGSAMNAIRALAGLGKSTYFTGMVADDEFGGRIRSRMEHLQINAHLSMSDEPTGSCVVLVTPDGERTMNTHLGASRLYDDSHIPEEDLPKAKVFHFCGYQWDTEGQKDAIYRAIKLAKKSNCLISFDVADPFVVQAHRNDFVEIIEKYADIVFANEEEAKLLYEGTPDETANKISDTGATAVIKLGSRGAMVRHNNEITLIDPVKTQVIDTTAAGDMFAGGYLYGVVSGCSTKKCGEFAATLASDVISRYGATLSEEAIGLVRSKLSV